MNWPPDIIKYEPHMALDGGISGLEFYERIIAAAYQYLEKSGILALEIGDEQMDAVFGLLNRHGYQKVRRSLILAAMCVV